ncbi:uncharacterized protein J3R85_002053 [Psidium guajava]|nr:uncharacterized protein J3R85_002053 [Psidium guajava]
MDGWVQSAIITFELPHASNSYNVGTTSKVLTFDLGHAEKPSGQSLIEGCHANRQNSPNSEETFLPFQCPREANLDNRVGSTKMVDLAGHLATASIVAASQPTRRREVVLMAGGCRRGGKLSSWLFIPL